LNTAVVRSVVELVDVSKEYATADGMLRAMDRVSLEIGDGEFVSVLGPSGCGKSTLMLIAAGLVAPTSGTVRVAGVEVRAPYRDVGIVLQDATLYEWRRALENVLLPAQIQRLDPRRSRQRALELLELVGLQGFERKYPFGLP
jgi:NitT/TauT family transport system ATP-binding protein